MRVRALKIVVVCGASLSLALLLFAGCGLQRQPEGDAKDVIKEIAEPFLPGQYIEYGNPVYQFGVKYPVDLISDFSSPDSKLILNFPESFTTGTNLGVAQIRLDINKSSCQDFGSGEDKTVIWHYAKTPVPSKDFTDKIVINGLEFRRLKCSDAAMSHVADSLVYITQRGENTISMNLYLVSSNPEVYDESIRPLAYDPAEMEKIFLQVLSSFKFKE